MILLFTLITLWVVLSGYFTFLPLVPGLISIPLIFLMFKKAQVATEHTSIFQVRFFVFIKYIPYILKEIYNSNIFVAKLILKKSSSYQPKIIQINNDFHNKSLATIFTNSVTLTPGSVTLIATEDTFIIHCVDVEVAKSFDDDSMKNKVKQLGDK